MSTERTVVVSEDAVILTREQAEFLERAIHSTLLALPTITHDAVVAEFRDSLRDIRDVLAEQVTA